MTILRFTVDIESEGDVTQDEAETMSDKLGKYADSVLGVQHLAEKQGDDGQVTWHVHSSTRHAACDTCYTNAQDLRS